MSDATTSIVIAMHDRLGKPWIKRIRSTEDRLVLIFHPRVADDDVPFSCGVYRALEFCLVAELEHLN